MSYDSKPWSNGRSLAILNSSRIAIEYMRAGKRHFAAVGGDFEGEVVSAIVDSGDWFLVFTPSNGGRRGTPVRVRKSWVFNVRRI